MTRRHVVSLLQYIALKSTYTSIADQGQCLTIDTIKGARREQLRG